MKEYVKPEIEFIELRPNERLAGCSDDIISIDSLTSKSMSSRRPPVKTCCGS
jgi:hypothetical protein